MVWILSVPVCKSRHTICACMQASPLLSALPNEAYSALPYVLAPVLSNPIAMAAHKAIGESSPLAQFTVRTQWPTGRNRGKIISRARKRAARSRTDILGRIHIAHWNTLQVNACWRVAKSLGHTT